MFFILSDLRWLRLAQLLICIIHLLLIILAFERFGQMLVFNLVYVAKSIKLVFEHLFVLVRQIAGDLAWLHRLHGLHCLHD